MITDSKSLYDAYLSQTGGLGLEEKRTALELVDLRERITEAGNIQLKWVNSEANLADSLTKPQARKPLESYFVSCQWAVTRDALERSARKRREQGITNPLEPTQTLTLPSSDNTGNQRQTATLRQDTHHPSYWYPSTDSDISND